MNIDFDDMPEEQVILICQRAMRRFRLHGFILFESSPNHYHAVFDSSARKNISSFSFCCDDNDILITAGFFVVPEKFGLGLGLNFNSPMIQG